MTISTAMISGIGDEAAPGLAAQLDIHTALGLAGIEMRSVDGRWLHEIDDHDVAAMGTAVEARGLTVPVVDTPIGNWARTVHTDLDEEIALLGVYARRARLLNCTQLRIMSYPNAGLPAHEWASAALDRIGHLVDAAGRLGVTLLHENCAGWAGDSADNTVRLMERHGGEHLALIFDIGNGKAYGYEALEFLSATARWVRHVHLKDAVTGPDGAVFVFPGEGDCQVRSCLELVHELPQLCWVSIEPHLATMPHLGVTGETEALRTSYTRYAEQALQHVVQVIGRATWAPA